MITDDSTLTIWSLLLLARFANDVSPSKDSELSLMMSFKEPLAKTQSLPCLISCFLASCKYKTFILLSLSQFVFQSSICSREQILSIGCAVGCFCCSGSDCIENMDADVQNTFENIARNSKYLFESLFSAILKNIDECSGSRSPLDHFLKKQENGWNDCREKCLRLSWEAVLAMVPVAASAVWAATGSRKSTPMSKIHSKTLLATRNIVLSHTKFSKTLMIAVGQGLLFDDFWKKQENGWKDCHNTLVDLINWLGIPQVLRSACCDFQKKQVLPMRLHHYHSTHSFQFSLFVLALQRAWNICRARSRSRQTRSCKSCNLQPLFCRA